MALTPQNSEAFMREVDDAVRQDQLTTFWQRYGRILIVLLVVVAGWWWKRTYHGKSSRVHIL